MALVRGAAGGLATMSAVQTGLISILYNSMPESVTRPLTQIAIPLLKAGFAPYDLAEIVGWHSTIFFYVVVACLLVVPIAAAMLPARQKLASYVVRIVAFAACGALAWFVATSEPTPEELADGGSDGTGDLQGLSSRWEPAGRDRIARLRLEAERHGPRGPCLWYKLADLERTVHWTAQSASDEHRAKGSRASCP